MTYRKVNMELKEISKLHIEGELEKLTDGNIKKFLISSIDRFPDYFWEAPASNSKYHPKDERQPGGLVLHVRRLIRLTEHMVRFYNLNAWERDVLISACILHDSFSRGIPPRTLNYTDPLHPVYVEYMFPFNADADRFIEKRVYDEIMECVSSHLGRFSPNKLLQSNKKLPMIFQLIDYIGSRENVKIDL